MTEISTIYNTMVTRMGTLFPNHRRLSNPQVIAQNSDQLLEKGWALAVGQAANSNRQISGNLSIVRSFTVWLTRRTFTREMDPTARATTEKDLLEDLQLLMDDLEENVTLDSGRYIARYLSDDGITQIRDDQDGFLGIAVNLSVEYFRAL